MKVIRLSARAEDYLHAISLLKLKCSPVRISDISKTMGVSAPGVIDALNKLSYAGLVKHQKYGKVELTVKGTAIAQDTNLRYETLRKFLFEIINVPSEIAKKDAQGMKHALSRTSQQRIYRLTKYLLEHKLVKKRIQRKADLNSDDN